MAGLEALEGRAAVVTGAASGIGLAVTEAFLASGMRVLMTDRDEERLVEHAERLASAGGEVRSRVVDVTDPDAVERAADAAIDEFGKLHVAMNNAGIVVGGDSWELPLSEWRRVVEFDLWGVIHGVHAFVPRIIASGEPGWVVNTASMAAVSVIAGIGPYTASKHGVLGLSDGLRATRLVPSSSSSSSIAGSRITSRARVFASHPVEPLAKVPEARPRTEGCAE